MAGRSRADEAVRVKGSNPAWLERDREIGGSVRQTAAVASKVKRYWAGKAPAWAEPEDVAASDDDVREEEDARRAQLDAQAWGAAATAHDGGSGGGDRSRRIPAAPVVVVRGDDARLRRIAQSRGGGHDNEDDDDDDDGGGVRAVQAARVIARSSMGAADQSSSESEPEADEDGPEEDEEVHDGRREAMRARLAARRRDEEDGGAAAGEEMAVEEEDDDRKRYPGGGGSEDEGSSSWETDSDASDAEGGPGRKMIKPVFVPKKERETIAEREKVEAEMDAEWERREMQKKKRAEESRQLVEIEVAREEEMAFVEANAEASEVDTDDDVDEAAEFESWQRREWSRIKEDREVREKFIAEREELERIRGMSEEDKAAWLAANPREDDTKERKKMGFMQKYYHKGAFFQEGSDDQFGTAGPHEIYKRDFSEATGEDRVDKSSLPKAMQLRKGQFGKMGQTKWTHLSAEDTTQFEDNPWMDKKSKALDEYSKKMAGNKQSFEKPKHLK